MHEGPGAGADEGDEPAPTSSEDLLETVEELLLGGHPTYTRAQVAQEVGLSLDETTAMWQSLGFPRTDDDAVVFTEADLRALSQTGKLIEQGLLDAGSRDALVRTWGRSFARLAEWQTSLLASVAAASGDPEQRMAQLALDVIPVVEELQGYVWRRHLLSASARLLVRPSVTDASSVQAVGFVDIVGYTSQSRHLEESELVALVEHFEAVATQTTVEHGGQLIKTIGDEVLLVADDAAAGAAIALELVERHEHDETFPEVRAGMAYGDVVSRLGDVYGPTVNIASRLTSLARPGSVLLDTGMHAALAAGDPDEERFRLRRVRRTSVKGYHRLEPWRLKRSGHDQRDERG